MKGQLLIDKFVYDTLLTAFNIKTNTNMIDFMNSEVNDFFSIS